MLTMKKYIFFLLLCSTLWACAPETESTCATTQNPLEDLDWLKKQKEAFELDMSPQQQIIVRYQYQNEDYFAISDCFNCPDYFTTFYNCLGEEICRTGGLIGENTCSSDFTKNAVKKETLFFE